MKIAWLVFGVILGASFTPILIEAVEYYGKFPPTAAWQEIETDDNATIPSQDNRTYVNATSYHDKLWIITDGSIEAYFIEFP